MNSPKIAKIDQSKLRENAYFSFRDAFTRSEFAPAAMVSLRDLADQFGTSMTPVREAVRLVAEGALTDTPSRKLIVPAFDVQRIQDLKRARPFPSGRRAGDRPHRDRSLAGRRYRKRRQCY